MALAGLVALVLLAYTYVGYPVIVGLWARIAPCF